MEIVAASTEKALPTKIWFGTPKVEFSIRWDMARKHSKFLARFKDDDNLPTHLFEDHPIQAFLRNKNFGQVWAVINGVGWTVPHNRYWIHHFQVDFFVLVRGFRIPDDIHGGLIPGSADPIFHVFANPSPDRMLLLERWFKLNQKGIMYSRDDPEDEQPNDGDYENMEMLLRQTPTVADLKAFPSFVMKINFLLTNW